MYKVEISLHLPNANMSPILRYVILFFLLLFMLHLRMFYRGLINNTCWTFSKVCFWHVSHETTPYFLIVLVVCSKGIPQLYTRVSVHALQLSVLELGQWQHYSVHLIHSKLICRICCYLITWHHHVTIILLITFCTVLI